MAVAADNKKSSGLRTTRIIVAAVALLGIVGAGAWYMVSRTEASDPAAALPAPAQYFPLAPPFVVNLDGTTMGPRYLQVEVQVVTRDPQAVDHLRTHAPALRARLLMLFAQQTYEGLATREGKEALRDEALGEVQAVMMAETGLPVAESLLFTSFVTQ
ncbi:flagellar basal body-associated FliL family protein [Luteimonas abyssi]|uniref:flagellar basal body-associated FliL family protein n=1 Tax=Luteimonas abyssi TaxID=1247514 RepID=UPI000737D068|nr:flagellar basal body-associated FliL family protein [Luteimonas abyssi]